MIDNRVFAVDKGDTYIMSGTLQEIADARGITLALAKFLTYPAYKKRIAKRMKRNPDAKCLSLTYVSGRRKREWPKHK